MKQEEFYKITDDLFKLGFVMSHAEQDHAVFNRGEDTLILNVPSEIEGYLSE